LTNRLAHENSPYLLQHAENPVDWWPWGERAFQSSRERDRPIFLSIGYAACHWCHVMAHESFEDPQTAELLNRDFIPVKVDREERPDVDAIYMDAVVAMTGQGGWPLSVFLTPEGQPFFGGTYFPPEGRYRLPSFREVLRAISTAWKEDRQRLLAAGQSLTDALSSAAAGAASDLPLDPGLLTTALDSLLRGYDWTHGGWGGPPKFPQTPVLLFLLDRYRRAGDHLALDMAHHALTAMGRGGLFDHLGGGFHRYSVDKRWSVPHFEKMLYDNALLARAYLRAGRATGEPSFRAVAEATLGFLHREMRDPRGAFYSSLDADSEGGEGSFYTWTPQEVQEALEDPEASARVRRFFHINEPGNLDGRSVLRLSPDVGIDSKDMQEEALAAPVVEQLRRVLFDARAKRPRPALDDKIVAAWNGLALTAWAEAARAWARPSDLETAQLLRSERAGRPGPLAFLEDHAAVGLGLLTLYQTDFDERWYAGAAGQAEAILSRFLDPTGTFFDTPSDHEPLLTRPRSLQDSPTPSGGAMAVELLQGLFGLTGEARYGEAASKALRAMQATAASHPTAFASWCQGMQAELSPTRQLAIVGDPRSSDFQALISAAWEADVPGIVLAGGRGEPSTIPLLAGRGLVDGRATAYLCEHFTCRLPVTSPAQLRAQLEELAPPPDRGASKTPSRWETGPA